MHERTLWVVPSECSVDGWMEESESSFTCDRAPDLAFAVCDASGSVSVSRDGHGPRTGFYSMASIVISSETHPIRKARARSETECNFMRVEAGEAEGRGIGSGRRERSAVVRDGFVHSQGPDGPDSGVDVSG